MYAFRGETRAEVTEDRREVACLRASLSVQDLLSVGGASDRDGLQRTAPRWEKLARPRRADATDDGDCSPPSIISEGNSTTVGGTLVHGVASSWASMTSSMLASPHGASEQYMWIWTSSRMAKGCCSCSTCSSIRRGRIHSDDESGGVDTKRHSSSRK
jgi:hypothetical protein